MSTILLVEDNPDDVELTVSAMREHGARAQIDVAGDGVEALEYLASHAIPDLIILDLKLPRMNGIELLERLRSDKRTKHVPVVILTSSVEDEDLVQGYASGANSYVRKPVDYDQFINVARALGDYWLHINHPSPGAVG